MLSGDECEAPPSFPCEHVYVEMLTGQQIISEAAQMPQTQDVYTENQCFSSEFQNLYHKINTYINKQASDFAQLINCKLCETFQMILLRALSHSTFFFFV